MTEELIEKANHEAFMSLIGLRPAREMNRGVGLKSALISLFRSDVPIAPQVREALAKALERGSDDPGVRLTIEGTGKGGKDDIGGQILTRQRWLIAGRHIEKLHVEGMGIDDAKREVGSLVDANGESFGYASSQASDAWAFFQKFRNYQTVRNEQLAKAGKNDTEPEEEQEAAFIIMAIYGGESAIANLANLISG